MYRTHILILEDDDQLSRMYEKVLQHAGYRTLRLSQISGAIENIPRFDPDIVLLDWHLSDSTSAPFLDYLITHHHAETLPQIAVISGRKVTLEATYQSQVALTLQKPISVTQLVNQVKALAAQGTGRKPFQHIEVLPLAADVVQINWYGRITAGLIQQTDHANLRQAQGIIFNMQNLCAFRFTMQDIEIGVYPPLPLLKRIYVVRDAEDAELAQSIIRHLGYPAEVNYYTNLEQAQAEAASVI